MSNATSKPAGPKIVVLGAGSYVFTVSLLYDLLHVHVMNGLHLVMVDVDQELATNIADLARRMALEVGLAVTVDATTDREAALVDADFVTCSAAIQLLSRYHEDKRILTKYGIKEVLSECGGLGGLSYALRQVPLLIGIAKDMERLCPEAWLLNVSNPLPRVLGAISRYTTTKVLGFCNVAYMAADGYGHVESLIGRSRHDINVVSGGLNHFSWLLGVTDRWTGEDLFPKVKEAMDAVAEGRTKKQYPGIGPYTVKLWRDYNCLALSGDTHVGEYLPFDPETLREHIAHHGNPAERAQRRAELAAAAKGTGDWRHMLAHRSWERPADVIHSLVTGVQRRLAMLNMPNNGAIEGLPQDAIVEVPAIVAKDGVRPVGVGPMPAPIADIVRQVSLVHSLVSQAAVTGDISVVYRAIDVDLAVPDKGKAKEAVRELLDAHSDVLPQFI